MEERGTGPGRSVLRFSTGSRGGKCAALLPGPLYRFPWRKVCCASAGPSLQVPVEERLHIEALRLLMENAKLRKCLNEYSEGLLHNTLIKIEPTSDNAQG
jgi:hypothetical protein